MKFLPKEAWIVSGTGESDTSKMNAWDRALLDAGIANHNFVRYTSILPKDVELRDFRKELVPGQEVNIILGIAYGIKGDTITAGIAFGEIDDCWLVAELEDKIEEGVARRNLEKMLREMADDRNAKLDKVEIETGSMKVEKEHGCVFVGIIFNPNNYR